MTLTTLTITDLTRMGGTRVCIAGINETGQTIRPELDHASIHEDWLFIDGIPRLVPFARIQFDLLEPFPDAPHTEDWIVRQDYKQPIGSISNHNRQEFLQRYAFDTVDEIFETEIAHESGFGYFIPYGEGVRSLGTILPNRCYDFVHIQYENGSIDYRLGFRDQCGKNYRLKITDLALRNYVDHLRIQQRLSFEQISAQLSETISSRHTYLRIGLARPTDPRHPGFCHLQINGVYTFPDYLNGRCFADFRPDMN